MVSPISFAARSFTSWQQRLLGDGARPHEPWEPLSRTVTRLKLKHLEQVTNLLSREKLARPKQSIWQEKYHHIKFFVTSIAMCACNPSKHRFTLNWHSKGNSITDNSPTWYKTPPGDSQKDSMRTYNLQTTSMR